MCYKGNSSLIANSLHLVSSNSALSISIVYPKICPGPLHVTILYSFNLLVLFATTTCFFIASLLANK